MQTNPIVTGERTVARVNLLEQQFNRGNYAAIESMFATITAQRDELLAVLKKLRADTVTRLGVDKETNTPFSYLIDAAIAKVEGEAQ